MIKGVKYLKVSKSNIAYSLLYCERCGKLKLESLTGFNTINHGYYLKDDFESNSDDWSFHNETGRLCPECSKLYDELIKNFIANNL